MAKNKSLSSPFASVGLRSFLTFCKPLRLKLLVVATVFVFANIAIAIQPVLIGMLVDAVSNSNIDTGATWMIVWLLIISSSGHNILWRLGEFLFRAHIFGASYRYETFMFRTVISRPYPYFVDKFTGKIGSYITSTSNELKWFLDNVMFDYIGSLVSVISVVWIMSSINWQTGLIVVLCLLGQVVVGKYTLAKDMSMQKIEADINSTKNGRIIDAIANFVSVKSFHQEGTEYREITKQQDKTLKAAKRSFLWGIIFWGTQSIIVRDLMWPTIIVINLFMLLQGNITIGQFTTLLATAVVFTQTIWQIVWNISQFGQRISKIEEAHTYLFGNKNIVKDSIVTDISTVSPVDFEQSFAIRHLNFAYPDKKNIDVLSDITLDIKHGEKIGVVGRSGSGKSTLVKLILDQYDTSEGTFQLDGKDISASSLSKFVSYVPQDTTLFHRSIHDNIAYAIGEDASREQVLQAAKKAEADEFIVKMSEKYDTLVGERGVKLSGGQRQRIAIARAILKDSPILVLDEATSALDSESEVLVQKALENLWHDKTVIAIAHRLSTLRNMDRIIVMDHGKIIEQGSHMSLIAHGGTYAKLWNHQSGGFIEE